MIAVCSVCKAEFRLDDTKVPAHGGFFKCRSCGGRVPIPARDAPGGPDASRARPDEVLGALGDDAASAPIQEMKAGSSSARPS
jgi:predicted Zn finger-like uncharacterized protein